MARHLTGIGVAMLTVLALLSAGPTALRLKTRDSTRRTAAANTCTGSTCTTRTTAKIDPEAEDARPLFPRYTCGRCHDYEAISHGYHFQRTLLPANRRGATANPGSGPTPGPARRYHCRIAIGRAPIILGSSALSDREFVLKFGQAHAGRRCWAKPLRHLPKHRPPKRTRRTRLPLRPRRVCRERLPRRSEDKSAGRWKLSGALSIDCMICHSNDHTFNAEAWWDQIGKENFAWASSVAIGLAQVAGGSGEAAGRLRSGGGRQRAKQLPKTTYTPLRVNAEKKIFFDVIRKPSNNACYYCHSTRTVGDGIAPEWVHDEDVHLRAGMSCTDCHRNGIAHHTVRGYDGEQHPTGQLIDNTVLPRLPYGRTLGRGESRMVVAWVHRNPCIRVCHHCIWSDCHARPATVVRGPRRTSRKYKRPWLTC